MKFKFIDDLTVLEKINLLSIGLTSYNFKNHVPSDIPTSGLYIPAKNLESQNHLDSISAWTKDNKMELNKKKSKAMVFNYTRNFQFSSRAQIEDEIIEIITETKLLGVIVTDDLKWDKNTLYLTRRANARMRLLHKLAEFSVPVEELVLIYTLFIRSILEQSCQVWHSSLSRENEQDLERVQKSALKIILKEEYQDYENALKITGLELLSARRSDLCLRFAQGCLEKEELKSMFPLNPNQSNMTTRKREKFLVTPSNTERLKKSAIPFMQRQLNCLTE